MNWIVFEEISDYIRAHFRDITIQDLVNEFHYQEDYFNRLIKRKTGLTYSAYLQQIRLERAEEAKERAEEQLRQKQSIQEYYLSQASMARAMTRLKASRNRRGDI